MQNATLAPVKARSELFAGGWPGGRRSLIVLAAAAAVAGLGLNWGWLTAIGVAPILLALAPCAAMCALGLCMMGGGKSCSSGGAQSAKGATSVSDN